VLPGDTPFVGLDKPFAEQKRTRTVGNEELRRLVWGAVRMASPGAAAGPAAAPALTRLMSGTALRGGGDGTADVRRRLCPLDRGRTRRHLI